MARMKTNQRGSMMVLGAGLLLVLTSFAVLGFDIGRIMIVRNELQNVADAAALAGANCLPRLSVAGSTTECQDVIAPSINWTRAAAKAQEALGRNSAANAAISRTDSGHQIEVGYWSLLNRAPSGGTFSTTFSPLTPNDKPAVRVSVTKDNGVNNGPVAMLTRLIFGTTTDVAMSARAVAVLSVPTAVSPGSPLLPLALNKCMFDKYWDSVNNQPQLADTATLTYVDGSGKTQTIPQTIGQPWELRIGSAYHYGTCDAGQWTSFSRNTNDVPTLRDFIFNGVPDPLSVGDPTWIEPGTKSTIYDAIAAKYPPGSDVTVVVVNSPDLSSLGQTPVIAYAGFHIDAIDKARKYIEGHFIPAAVTAGSSGVGPVFYGTYTPPRLGF